MLNFCNWNHASDLSPVSSSACPAAPGPSSHTGRSHDAHRGPLTCSHLYWHVSNDFQVFLRVSVTCWFITSQEEVLMFPGSELVAVAVVLLWWCCGVAGTQAVAVKVDHDVGRASNAFNVGGLEDLLRGTQWGHFFQHPVRSVMYVPAPTQNHMPNSINFLTFYRYVFPSIYYFPLPFFFLPISSEIFSIPCPSNYHQLHLKIIQITNTELNTSQKKRKGTFIRDWDPHRRQKLTLVLHEWIRTLPLRLDLAQKEVFGRSSLL